MTSSEDKLPTGRSYKSTTRDWLQHMTTPPFTADKAEDLYNLIIDQFENLNEDVSPLLQKLNELKSAERYALNTQFEQVSFRDLGAAQNITAMVEQVQINEQEHTLLVGVINDLVRRYQGRQRLPYPSIRHFKDFC